LLKLFINDISDMIAQKGNNIASNSNQLNEIVPEYRSIV